MARIIGQVESMKTLKSELNKRKVKRFNSIGDINKFSRGFVEEKQKVLDFHKKSISEEIKQKSRELKDYEIKLELLRTDEINKLNKRIQDYKDRKKILELRRSSASLLVKVILYFRIRNLFKKISYLTDNYELIINDSISHLNKEKNLICNHLTYLSENKQEAIYERSKIELNELEHAKKVIDELKALIAGAIGESLVENEIGKLSDDYTLINDFSLKFSPPIYNKKTNDKIYSIQLDHLLVSRAGLFILETKNWSKDSIRSLDLRSPVEQIMRTSYAMFIVVNKMIHLDRHHWGTKQIPIRNIIVMIHSKPKEKFKYVKVKLLKELNSYIEFFEPVLSQSEVNRVTDFLMSKMD